MLRSLDHLQGDTIRATDGDVGKVDQFFFDDHTWTVRYLVANTGNWLTGRLVLLSPQSIRSIDRSGKEIVFDLSREQIENSPDVSADEPVSRQREEEFNQYYGWTPYWGGAGIWTAGGGPVGIPSAANAPIQPRAEDVEGKVEGNPNLRSSREVHGYNIEATDGTLGEVADFIVDDESWAVRYMVVDTRRWLPGKKVLVAPQWIRRVAWEDALVEVDLTKNKIKDAPEYDPSKTEITRDYEDQLHSYYGKPRYWEGG